MGGTVAPSGKHENVCCNVPKQNFVLAVGYFADEIAKIPKAVAADSQRDKAPAPLGRGSAIRRILQGKQKVKGKHGASINRRAGRIGRAKTSGG